MTRSTRLLALALSLAGASLASTAAAEDEAPTTGARMPAAYTQRPLTLPAMTAMGEAGFSIFKVFPGLIRDPLVGLHVGGSFGILDDLQVDATLIPLLLSPQVEYGNPSLGAMYRFTDDDVQVGVRTRLFLPARKGTSALLMAGVPVLIHVDESLRIDTGVTFAFDFANKTQVSLAGLSDLQSFDPGVPLRITAQATDELAIGGGTGLGIFSFDFPSETLFIPLSLHGVYTIPNDEGAPFVDVGAQFGFPFFLTPGSPRDVANPDTFYIGLTGKGYFYL